ncbi:Hypp4413 [Branchiostoma lanceolatum]|uniref:Hypp4413 protein n=1 Tax=Branchiostoma lanceolatum TaxID=7740 RepID=A0A8K0A8H2_BRALA|nr:Hypp4413 [Branchiostoma lanceolatum]
MTLNGGPVFEESYTSSTLKDPPDLSKRVGVLFGESGSNLTVTMGYKLAMFLGLSALLMVLMVDQAESRLVPQEVRSLLELLREDQEDIAPEEDAMPARGLGEHDTDQDERLSKFLTKIGEIVNLVPLPKADIKSYIIGKDINNLPDGWLEDTDTNKDGSIDRAEFATEILAMIGKNIDDLPDVRGRPVTKAKIVELMKKNGASAEDLPDGWFEDADHNGDGSIDHAEFDALKGQFGRDGGDPTNLARRIVEEARGLLELLREEKRGPIIIPG